MKLYIIRHGESETNFSQKWTGWLDVALTEKGYRDAEKAKAFLSTVPFDRVYSSDLRRAMRTAETALPGFPFEVSPLLREINVGTLSGKPSSALTPEARARVPQLGYSEFGGETFEELHSRAVAFLKIVESLDCENVAVFAHAGILRELLSTVLGTRIPANRLCCYNCAILILEYANQTWRLYSWLNF